jgi:regulation of enolase protein 1 (concanavalin A-like superfamily)
VAQSPFPFPLRPLGTPLSSSVDGDAVTIVAGPRTDWFVDPGLSTAKLDAPGLVGATSGDFQFSACVEVEFAATFDAGVLAVWRDEQTWA